jgi:sec-independent protein translocase protein TatA
MRAKKEIREVSSLIGIMRAILSFEN